MRILSDDPQKRLDNNEAGPASSPVNRQAEKMARKLAIRLFIFLAVIMLIQLTVALHGLAFGRYGATFHAIRAQILLFFLDEAIMLAIFLLLKPYWAGLQLVIASFSLFFAPYFFTLLVLSIPS